MANLNGLGAPSRGRRLRPYVVGVFVLLVGVLCVSRAFVQAAPITFRFDATIGPPRQGTFPIELPFSFAEGDHISGSFTFEPFDAPSDAFQTVNSQNSTFKLQIGSVVLSNFHYSIQADNNLVSDDGPIPEDRLLLQCLGTGNQCLASPIDGADHVAWSFGWTLNGGSGILDGPDIPASIETWNQLLPSSILVSFHDNTTGRGTGFQATIDALHVVSEPTTAAILAIVCVVAFAFPALNCGRRRKTFS
jgi:hypothetical protein